MKVEVKKVDAIRREMRFEIPKERVSKAMDEVYSDLAKVAKIKGFRPGKIPRHVLESQHSKLAQEETIKKLIPEVYHEGIDQEKISPIDLPEIVDVSFKDGTITFKAKIDIKPEVVIKDYKGIKVKRKSAQVTDDEITKTLEYFKQGQDVAIDDGFARGLGYPNLDEFKKILVRQMELDKDRHNRLDIENQIIEELLKKAKVMAPPSLMHKQLEHRIEEQKRRFKSQGLSEQEIAEKEKTLHKDLEPVVERDIKVYLVLDKIKELENIEIKEGDNLPAKIIAFLLKEAKWEEAK